MYNWQRGKELLEPPFSYTQEQFLDLIKAGELLPCDGELEMSSSGSPSLPKPIPLNSSTDQQLMANYFIGNIQETIKTADGIPLVITNNDEARVSEEVSRIVKKARYSERIDCEHLPLVMAETDSDSLGVLWGELGLADINDFTGINEVNTRNICERIRAWKWIIDQWTGFGYFELEPRNLDIYKEGQFSNIVTDGATRFMPLTELQEHACRLKSAFNVTLPLQRLFPETAQSGDASLNDTNRPSRKADYRTGQWEKATAIVRVLVERNPAITLAEIKCDEAFLRCFRKELPNDKQISKKLNEWGIRRPGGARSKRTSHRPPS